MLLICCQNKPNMRSKVNALTLNIKLVVTDVNSYRVTLLLPMVLRSLWPFVKESPPMPDARAPRKLISEAKILFSRYQHRATGEISLLRFFFFTEMEIFLPVTAPDRYNCLFDPGLLDNTH